MDECRCHIDVSLCLSLSLPRCLGVHERVNNNKMLGGGGTEDQGGVARSLEKAQGCL